MIFKKEFLFFLHIFFCVKFSEAAFPQFYCTAADSRYFDQVKAFIGSVHKSNKDNLEQIAVFDLGFTQEQIAELSRMYKVGVYSVELTHPDLLKPVHAYVERSNGWWGDWAKTKMVPGYYAWKPVVIKQALDMFPYVLWIDAGNVILHPIDDLFTHIVQNGYFFIGGGNLLDWHTTKYVQEKFKLQNPENKWLLDRQQIEAGVIGILKHHSIYTDVLLPVYELTHDLRNFENDGSSKFFFPGFEQAIFSIYLHKNNYAIQTYKPECKVEVSINAQQKPFYINEIPDAKTQIGYVRGWGVRVGLDKHVIYNGKGVK